VEAGDRFQLGHFFTRSTSPVRGHPSAHLISERTFRVETGSHVHVSRYLPPFAEKKLREIGANYVLLSALCRRTQLASAARLATERRACIPGRRASSVQHGNAAMPKPIKDIPLACLPSPPRGFVWTGRNG
jgi:hypothetical protein